MTRRVLAVLLAGALGACSGSGDSQADDDRRGVEDDAADIGSLRDGESVDRTTMEDGPALDSLEVETIAADRPGATDAVAQGSEVAIDAVLPSVDQSAADAGPTDAGALDGSAFDGAAPDRAASDVRVDAITAIDVSGGDAPDVVDAAGAPDRPSGFDAALDVEAATGADAATVDRPAMEVGVDAARDVPASDVPASDAGCPGAGPSVVVAAPTSGEAIETCSATNQAVFYDFVATVSPAVGASSVSARWITPSGTEAPPPAALNAPPYRFHRQVGGPSTGSPALSVFGIRGTWQVEFAATDACGRRTVTAQPFTLIYTTRRCPNP